MHLILLYNDKNSWKKEGCSVAKENKENEMQSVTIRIPRELYLDYKKTLMDQGKIVTYDVRKYMKIIGKGKNRHKKRAPLVRLRST